MTTGNDIGGSGFESGDYPALWRVPDAARIPRELWDYDGGMPPVLWEPEADRTVTLLEDHTLASRVVAWRREVAGSLGLRALDGEPGCRVYGPGETPDEDDMIVEALTCLPLHGYFASPVTTSSYRSRLPFHRHPVGNGSVRPHGTHPRGRKAHS